MLFSWFNSHILNGGIKASDSAAVARAIRISNLIAVSAIFNTLVFAVFFYFFKDYSLLQDACVVGLIYISCLLMTVMGATTLGIVSLLIFGNAVVFYFSCIFRGEADLQLLFYSLTACAFMHFSW